MTPTPEAQDPELALHWEIRPGIPAVPAARHQRLLEKEPASEPAPDDAPALAFVARMAQACAEVAYGARPASQLKRWVHRTPLDMLARHGECVVRHPSSRQGTIDRTFHVVRGIRVLRVSEGAYETSAVLIGKRRSRAIAMRLEWHGDAWLVTAVQV